MLMIKIFDGYSSLFWESGPKNLHLFSGRLCFLHADCTDKSFSIDDFSFAVFWSDHCSPKLITTFPGTLTS